MSKVKTNYDITIKNMPASYVRILAKWASVQRTINLACDVMEDTMSHPHDDRVDDDIDLCLNELRSIGPALDWLHQLVRDQMWEQGWEGERDA